MKEQVPVKPLINACELCKPMGACLAFRGIEKAVPFLHGPQDCASKIRRYLFGHFREPIAIVSSSFDERQSIYGGGANLRQGLQNVMMKYEVGLIGIASTCLSEHIGDNIQLLVKEFCSETAVQLDIPAVPLIVTVSASSCTGTPMEGFNAVVCDLVEQISDNQVNTRAVNLLPGFVSPADLRYVKEILSDFGITGIILPDISETLDGPSLEENITTPPGGTPLADIRAMGGSRSTLEFGRTLSGQPSAGNLLLKRFGVKLLRTGTPIGLHETDIFFNLLENLGDCSTPIKYSQERGRLLDAYIDGQKYVLGKRVVIFGEEDLVVGLTSLLAEIGAQPVLCGSGGRSGRLHEAITKVTQHLLTDPPIVREGVNFQDIAAEVESMSPDLIISHSRIQRFARQWGIPLIRVGFPIHDRFDGQRILHLGYRGAHELYDRIVNALVEKKQEDSFAYYEYL